MSIITVRYVITPLNIYEINILVIVVDDDILVYLLFNLTF